MYEAWLVLVLTVRTFAMEVAICRLAIFRLWGKGCKAENELFSTLQPRRHVNTFQRCHNWKVLTGKLSPRYSNHTLFLHYNPKKKIMIQNTMSRMISDWPEYLIGGVFWRWWIAFAWALDTIPKRFEINSESQEFWRVDIPPTLRFALVNATRRGTLI